MTTDVVRCGAKGDQMCKGTKIPLCPKIIKQLKNNGIRRKQITSKIFSCVQATLQLALSAGRSVGVILLF